MTQLAALIILNVSVSCSVHPPVICSACFLSSHCCPRLSSSLHSASSFLCMLPFTALPYAFLQWALLKVASCTIGIVPCPCYPQPWVSTITVNGAAQFKLEFMEIELSHFVKRHDCVHCTSGMTHALLSPQQLMVM